MKKLLLLVCLASSLNSGAFAEKLTDGCYWKYNDPYNDLYICKGGKYTYKHSFVPRKYFEVSKQQGKEYFYQYVAKHKDKPSIHLEMTPDGIIEIPFQYMP